MKKIVFLLILILPLQLFSQEWILEENSDVKVKKEGRTYYMSFIDDESYSLTFEADSIYFDKQGNHMFVRDNIKGKLGIIDPWDLAWRIEISLSYFEYLNKDIDWLFLGKEKGKYNIYEIDEFYPIYKKGFDTLFSFNIDHSEWKPIYKIMNKGKYGLINIDDYEIHLETKYSDIQPIHELKDDLLFYITKGKKKGVYSIYEYYEIILPEYEEISLLFSDRSSYLFKVKKKGKYGVVINDDNEIIEAVYDDIKIVTEKDYPSNYFFIAEKNGLYAFFYNNEQSIPCIIEEYKMIGKPWPHGYILLKSNGKYDLMEDVFSFKPKYDNVKIEENDDMIILHIEAAGDFSTMKIKK